MILEWHLKGPCIWAASFLSLVACSLLLWVNLRSRKSYSVFTLYAVLISLSGAIMTLMAQTTFIQEGMSIRAMPSWVRSLREFTLSDYWTFPRDFFPCAIDLLVGVDCLNRYLIICQPERKDDFLSKKITCLMIVGIVLVSSIFAGLTTKMEADLSNMWETLGNFLHPVTNPEHRRYAWLYCGVLKVSALPLNAD